MITFKNTDGTYTLKVNGVVSIVSKQQVNNFWERMSCNKFGKPTKK